MTLYKTTALLAALAMAAGADTLILRDGREIHGQYVGGSARQVSMQTPDGGTQTFDVDRVQSVSFSNQAQNQPQVSEQGAFPHRGVIVPAGTSVVVRMIDPVNSSDAAIGQTFRATLDEPLVVGNDVIAQRGAEVRTRLVSLTGQLEGRTRPALALESIVIDGRPLKVQSNDVTEIVARAGAATAAVTSGEHVFIPAETRLRYRIESDVRLDAPRD